ncbi:MAG: BMP family ABC transporter substrate-binding protein [Clostridia bacterium]|nr:BMP family ABC transporter substrate-binding protein [Clostridia bacterium]MBQ5795122.1 BMP family ABC transporter substrate-binding protein [Kiritimatiellia bacterium]
MKKILSAILVVLMCVSMFAFVGCSGTEEFKVGFIFLHDENSTYDKNFIDAAVEACKNMGVTMVQKTQIPESTACYDAAKELIEVDGCKVIFADSFGHESFLMDAAREYPDVQFCHATGTQAHTAGLDNFHNAFASIYEGRYIAGVVAGMKLNELKEAGKLKGDVPKMGYVGAFTFAEVISGYTSFYLGAKSVCEDVIMDVKFTGSWYDETKEKQAAQMLIDGGCDLISQHADSMGSPTACENAGIPNVSYNGSTAAACPNTFLISSRINWVPYFEYMITQAKEGKAIDTDWTGTIENGAVALTDLGTAVAEGTAEKIEEVKAGLKDGSINVFDTANFTVGGKTLDSYTADVDTDKDFTPDTEAIEGGIFYESKHRSGPYFDVRIDGITLLDEAY